MQTAFARMPGGQPASGAPVSTVEAAAQATTGAEAQKSTPETAQATTGAQAQKSAESMQTAFARMPGGQASSGAPVSAAAASAQATTGAEAQKLVSYGQVTSMVTVATGASQDVGTSLLLSRVAVSAYGVTS